MFHSFQTFAATVMRILKYTGLWPEILRYVKTVTLFENDEFSLVMT